MCVRAIWLRALILVLAVQLGQVRGTLAQMPPPLIDHNLAAVLRARVATRPDDATAWRLLGRLLSQQGDLAGAHDAFQHAVRLDPESASAQHDLGLTLLALGHHAEAANHLQQVLQLAPGSTYAEAASVHLSALPGGFDPGVMPVDFEVEWLDNPATETLPRVAGPSRLYLRLESGLLYNSNVELAPISRELSTSELASFQLYFAADVEYAFLATEEWYAGALLRSYVNFNEAPYRAFNLRHVAPGVFVERPMTWQDAQFVPRLEYNVAYDAFDTATLGIRHSLATSVAAYWTSNWSSIVYWVLDYTQFKDDGEFPEITSLDGWNQAIGTSLDYATGWPWLSLVRVGADAQLADVEGSSYSYRGVMLYSETETPIVLDSLLVFQLGWGYRDYPDFEFSPSRNENIWRAGVEWRVPLAACWYLTSSLRYDRFDSRNELFNASRYTTGVWVTYER